MPGTGGEDAILFRAIFMPTTKTNIESHIYDHAMKPVN